MQIIRIIVAFASNLETTTKVYKSKNEEAGVALLTNMGTVLFQQTDYFQSLFRYFYAKMQFVQHSIFPFFYDASSTAKLRTEFRSVVAQPAWNFMMGMVAEEFGASWEQVAVSQRTHVARNLEGAALAA